MSTANGSWPSSSASSNSEWRSVATRPRPKTRSNKASDSSPWKALYPGLAIFIASLAFNYIGDGLRNALDPA